METEILQQVQELICGEKLAIGNDIIFMPGFKKSFNETFKQKVFTVNEIRYCDQFDDPMLRYASTWAAKEAVYKVLKQVDMSAVSWKKIEIIRERIAGKPLVILPAATKHSISLSISHDGDYVWAIALIKKGLQ